MTKHRVSVSERGQTDVANDAWALLSREESFCRLLEGGILSATPDFRRSHTTAERVLRGVGAVRRCRDRGTGKGAGGPDGVAFACDEFGFQGRARRESGFRPRRVGGVADTAFPVGGHEVRVGIAGVRV